MLFTREQIDELLNVIEYHSSFTAGIGIGPKVLSSEDLSLLSEYGIKLTDFSQSLTPLDKLYYFGKLVGILQSKQVETVEYKDFLKYIKEGQYIPLTKREQFELDIAKQKVYTHLKGLKDRMKRSVETTILDEEKHLYDSRIKEGMISGVEKRKSISAIISDFGHQMKTWEHDWGRIVETESNNIFQAGKALKFLEEDEDCIVYKVVYPQACRHCIQAYLKAGLGSQPKLFKLIDLMKNGDNVGRKVADWKPVVGSHHPFCRCDLRKKQKGYIWNDTTKRFELPKNFERKVERKSKITITVGDKVFIV